MTGTFFAKDLAFADRHPTPVVLTSDPRDLSALAEQAIRPITIAAT